jgi:hypothetical protein
MPLINQIVAINCVYQVRANSYLIRKGLSRKAQLCHYLNKFTTKNRSSVLVAAVPESMSIETWVSGFFLYQAVA